MHRLHFKNNETIYVIRVENTTTHKNLVKVYPNWKNRVPGIFNKQRRYDFQTDLC